MRLGKRLDPASERRIQKAKPRPIILVPRRHNGIVKIRSCKQNYHQQEQRGDTRGGIHQDKFMEKDYASIIGKTVTVAVGRPLESRHPQHENIVYPLNYGFVQCVAAGDGEDQDAYILGIDIPVSVFISKVIAVIQRSADAEDKRGVAPENLISKEQGIADRVFFQERCFRTRIWI